MSRWEPLLAVQQHDIHVSQLEHRAGTLPQREQLTRNEGVARDLDKRIAAVEGRLGELGRSQQRLQDEVASLTDRAKQADERLSQVRNPREAQALSDDVDSIRRRIDQLEDEELEIMELLEPVDAEHADLLAERARVDEEAQRLRTELAESESAIEAELAAVRSQRDEVAAQVPEDLWPEYDRLRVQHGGVAIARLVGSTCQGCHLALSAIEVDRIKRLPPDEPVHCEECGRLLVRD